MTEPHPHRQHYDKRTGMGDSYGVDMNAVEDPVLHQRFMQLEVVPFSPSIMMISAHCGSVTACLPLAAAGVRPAARHHAEAGHATHGRATVVVRRLRDLSSLQGRPRCF